MRPARACRQCRVSKRKCIAVNPDNGAFTSCLACQQQQIECSKLGALRTGPFQIVSAPVITQSTDNADRGGVSKVLPSSVVVEFVELYIRYVHDRPHSLFHEKSLWNDIQAGTISECLLMAICAMGCRFSSRLDRHSLSQMLRKRSSSLFSQQLEDISLVSIRSCILLANLYAAEQEHQLEALYFGIASRMAQVSKYDDTQQEDLPVVREVKRRTWWSLFMADKWCPSALGLSPALRSTIQDTELPMDEVIFQAMDPLYNQPHNHSEGLWKYKITLVDILGSIQVLNKSLAERPPLRQMIEPRVEQLAQQLQTWYTSLPDRMLLKDENLDRYRTHGYGGTFVALHLGYHHYSTLLYFPYLDRAAHPASNSSSYVSRCRFHALSFSKLLRHARGKGDCSVVYLTVAHMTTVSSSVLLHMLLYGTDEEVEVAREYLVSNFETLMELKQYWPHIDQIARRLLIFQNVCLHSSDESAYRVDGWMVRFLLEHALPLVDRSETDISVSSLGQRSVVSSARVDILDRALAGLSE